LGFAVKKVAGGKLVEAEVEASDGRITRVRITGDFFAHPEDVVEEVEKRLVGSRLDWEEVVGRVSSAVADLNAILVGVSVTDLAEVVLKAAGVEPQ